MFTMDLFPLVLGDLCLCRKNTQKHQISNTRSKWSKAEPPRATWWGRPTSPSVGRRGNTCATTNPWEWPRNTLSSSSHRWFKVSARSKAEKVHHMDCGLTMLMSVLKWTKHLHTHTLLHLKGPHSKGGGPTRQWGSADALPRRPMAYFHQTDSPLDTCKKTPCGETWCVGLRRFHWWLIQGLCGALPQIDDVVMEEPLLLAL
jgi:hypothetical protein